MGADQPYFDAARTDEQRRCASGNNFHMAPNLITPYLIMLTAYIAQAILLEATLSYLGLGVTEPTPAWGLMLSGNAQDHFMRAPWPVIVPGIAISLAVIAFNLFGDADFLDPRLRK